MARHALHAGSPDPLMGHLLASWAPGSLLLHLGCPEEDLLHLLAESGFRVTIASHPVSAAHWTNANVSVLDVDPRRARLEQTFDAVIVHPGTLVAPGTLRSQIAVLDAAANHLADGGVVLVETPPADGNVRFPTPSELDLIAGSVALRLPHRTSAFECEGMTSTPVASIYGLPS